MRMLRFVSLTAVTAFGLSLAASATPIQNPAAALKKAQVQLRGHYNAQVPSVPEPSSIALLGTGILGAAGMARKRFRRS